VDFFPDLAISSSIEYAAKSLFTPIFIFQGMVPHQVLKIEE
jgi:hypothetical protein